RCYNVYSTPDGWDIERHERIIQPPSPFSILRTVEGVTAFMDELESAEQTRLASEQLSRELDIAAITEAEGLEVVHRLLNY
ncbi:MAG TPA: hypothetical protein VF809_03475, partial [Candidatus Saccharimonadales bacterium]